MNSYLLPIAKRLTEEDIQALISSGTREDRRIDFKIEYLPQTSGGQNKLMKAIAGFANARGGHVVMGIEEKAGMAVRIKPLAENDEDKCKLQILSSVRAQIRPPLSGIDIQLVRLATGGTVAVIFVPKSWNAPHMVADGRFLMRHDAQTIPMDYNEIKEAFLAESSIAARLRAFRRERCEAISANRTTQPLYSQARIVLHVLPFDMLGNPYRLDIRTIGEKCKTLKPIYHEYEWGGDCTPDLDGAYIAQPIGGQRGMVGGYVYVFRSGCIEAVDTAVLSVRDPDKSASGLQIPYLLLERSIIESLRSYESALSGLELNPPYAIFLSLLGVQGYQMPWNEGRHPGTPIRHTDLLIPEAVVETGPADFERMMFPVFNSIWNACGLPQSWNYDSRGNWKVSK